MNNRFFREIAVMAMIQQHMLREATALPSLICNCPASFASPKAQERLRHLCVGNELFCYGVK
jgi:hypothetical protein